MSKAYLKDYYEMVEDRARLGIDPLPLNARQTRELCELLASGHADAAELTQLLASRVPPGVDDAAKVKAEFLADVANGRRQVATISPQQAVTMLGNMKGGYNIAPLIGLLRDGTLGTAARDALAQTLLIYDAFEDVAALSREGVKTAGELIEAWAEATWFTQRPTLPEAIELTVFKVTGEQNTDDFSPATDAWSRPDIPLHALAMFKNPREGLKPDQEGVRGPLTLIEELKKKGRDLVFVGDVVGTGSSRKSATNSLLWHIGKNIPGVPNKRDGGFVFGGKIAPIFYNTLEDSGALPIEMDVTGMNMGDEVVLRLNDGKVLSHDGRELASFTLKTDILLDEVRAGGRIPLIIGRALTNRARKFLGRPESEVFRRPPAVPESSKGFTRAQKIVGRACGLPGVRPGQSVEVMCTTVGSQDTTGPMTRDELKDLACLKFSAPLVMQSFCHTAAYPKPVDVITHQTLPEFFESRGGVALRPGDGVIHSWINRMILPDTIGTGGDSHTRFPLGVSFPAGSGLVAFAAATGMMPLDMPESVLVRFTGKCRPGITLRDLVHAIPYYAIQAGLLTVEKKGKKNVFSGRILEIEGLEHLDVEHAFELADASAERSAAGCGIRLNTEQVVRYLKSNIVLLRQMAEDGYQDRDTILKRAQAMEDWIARPELIEGDADCEYAAVIEINMNEIAEPILCAPNDPDDAHLLSDFTGTKIDEVFIGSCMTNIGHYRAASRIFQQSPGEVPVRLWLAPPTRMDKDQLMSEGVYSVFGKAGARIEMPGCSLCMGNQAQVRENATVVSTSTRNFPNRLGKNTNVFLSSAELAAVVAKLGRMPSAQEYFDELKVLEGHEQKVYTLMDFHEQPAPAARS